MRRVKRLLPVAAATLALVALAGCSDDPQVAARVGSQSIPVSDVNVLSNALCAEQASSSGSAPTPLSAVRASALSALIESHVDAQYARADRLTYDPLTLAQEVGQLGSLVKRLPESQRAQATTLITTLLKGELQVSGAAVSALKAAGQSVTQQSEETAVRQLEAAYAKRLRIKVNPRFQSNGLGATGADAGPSVSQAVSAQALAAQAVLRGTSESSYAAGLPADQRCG